MAAQIAASVDGMLARSPANPILVNGPAAYDRDKVGPRVVLKVGPGDYRMWYEAVPAGNRSTVGYATSPDGLLWTKRGEVLRPSADWEAGPQGEVSPNSILVEGGRYRLWYHSYGPDTRRRIGYACSPDGLHWTKHPEPVLDVGPAGSWDDGLACEPRVFPVTGGYILFYIGKQLAYSFSYGLGLAHSPDGVHWTKDAQNPVFGVGWEGWSGGGFAGPGIVQDGSLFRMWYADTVASTLHYADSPDGRTWTLGAYNPVLAAPSDPSAPDLHLGDSVSAYRDGNEFRILYGGFNFTPPVRRCICMATVRAPDCAEESRH